MRKDFSNMYVASKKQWSPWWGCNFDCAYCRTSFKAIAKRFMGELCEDCAEFRPHFHESRLTVSLPRTKPGEFIFACSSGDVSFCPTEDFEKILAVIRKKNDRTFLLQSKNPETFNRIEIPANVILGTTIESNRDAVVSQFTKAPAPSRRFADMLALDHPRKMLTLEPVMEFDHDVMMDWISAIGPEMVWLGIDSKRNGAGESRSGLPEPSKDEFFYLKEEILAAGFNLIMKTEPR